MSLTVSNTPTNLPLASSNQHPQGKLGSHKVAPVSNDGKLIGCGFGFLGILILVAGIVLWIVGSQLTPVNPGLVLAGKWMVAIPLTLTGVSLLSYCACNGAGKVASRFQEFIMLYIVASFFFLLLE